VPHFTFKLDVLPGQSHQVLEILIANRVDDSFRDKHILGAKLDASAARSRDR